MTTDKSSLVNDVVKKVTSGYTLEADFVNDMKTQLVEVLAPYYIYNAPPGGKTKRKKSDKPRKTSAYNQFVKTQMATDEVKALPQKARMGHIGKLWKALDNAGKKPYQDMADELNAANEAAGATPAPAVAQAAGGDT